MGQEVIDTKIIRKYLMSYRLLLPDGLKKINVKLYLSKRSLIRTLVIIFNEFHNRPLIGKT